MRSSLIGFALAAVAAWEGSALAYEIAHTDDGDMVRWHSPPSFETTMDGQPMPGNAGVAALRAAAETWNDALPEGLRIDVGPGHDRARVDPSDRVSSVVWFDDRFEDDFDPFALGATVRVYFANSGELVEADIGINGAGYDWAIGNLADCQQAYDLQAVLTHELGHALGLDHNEAERGAVMFPAIGSCHAKRELSGDDRDGVATLYDLYEPPADGPVLDVFSCSVSGGDGTWCWGLLILFAVTVHRKRRIGPAVASFAVLLGASAGSVDAAVVRAVDIDRLAALSTSVMRGRVLDQRVIRDAGRIYTETTVAADECWRGACEKTFTVRQLGGASDDIAMDVSGSATLTVGDDVVMFLRRRQDNAWAPLGMAQGLFVIRGSERNLRAVRDTSELVLVGQDGAVTDGRLESYELDALQRTVKQTK